MEQTLVNKFERFLADKEASEFFLTGVAGTGKTTSLAELIEVCMERKLTTVTCAYTHRAVVVLRYKLPPQTEKHVICTLHSYLKKRPTIDMGATKVDHVDGNAQAAIPELVNILFVDEFSMVGERDYVDIAALQYNEEGDLVTKVVYIGDPNQLPPVKDQQSVRPGGDYHVHLTKIYRQAGDNPLIDTLLSINDYINGKPAQPMIGHEKLIRGVDIAEEYKNCKTSKILLAYTNARVEFLNSVVQGRVQPLVNDSVFSPTTRQLYRLEAMEESADFIIAINGDIVELDSKYKTLETIHKIPGVKFFALEDENGYMAQRAVIFGHDTYLKKQQELAKVAVDINKRIEAQHKINPKDWARDNWSQPMAKDRSAAWRNYLAFKGNVICVDFAHAMTVHKSQGSTYENVFIDTEDLGRCADNDYTMYLRLLYVAISRASDTVYTN